MADGGAMKCAAITPEVFGDYRLHRGDVLFNRTNSIEHVGKTGIFDLEGEYCLPPTSFASCPTARKCSRSSSPA
jgi:hypothetical protein